MSRVLLCGAFGQDNPGDDALLDAFLRACAGHELLVTSAGPVPDAATRVPATARAVARAVRDVDAVVAAGGTVFKSLHPSSGRAPTSLLTRTALVQGAAAARGIPFALVGVGAGELRGRRARRLAAWIADHADLLVLRDEESAAVLLDAGATGPFRVGGDLAWMLLDPRVPVPRRAETPGHHDATVLVALSHLSDRDASRLADRLGVVVERLLERGHPVALQPWQGAAGADARLAADVVDRVGSELVTVLPPPASLHEARSSAAAHRAVVALRFHGLVAAAAAGTPALSLAHEPKLAGLARRLGQPAVPSHAAPTVLAHAADELLDTAPPTRAAVVREVEAAEKAIALLRLVLSAGAEDDAVDGAALDLSTGVPW